MCLKPSVIAPIPANTVYTARAAFPKGNLYLSMRDELGALFEDSDFTALYPRRGQPALAPWRLALITVMQFLENLSDRQAANQVRSRIDWKYVLSLELTDARFDYSVLSNFRERLLANAQQALLFDRVIERLREKKLLKERGKQRTDSTHVLAAIRTMNRLEMVGETLRAALNELAVAAPVWLGAVALPEWFARYGMRIEDTRLPRAAKAREEFAAQIGDDGFHLLKRLADEQPDLLKLEKVQILQSVWQRHYSRSETGKSDWRRTAELSKADSAIESPYDCEARFSTKRHLSWTGYKVHLSETCDQNLPRLITNVQTTRATEQDVAWTAAIHQSLKENNRLPSRHFVDAGYVDAELLVESAAKYGVELFGPTRLNRSWQARTGGIDAAQFQVDWQRQTARCPANKQSVYWHQYQTRTRYPQTLVKIKFKADDCRRCPDRSRCLKTESKAGRSLNLLPQPLYEALAATRKLFSSENGKHEYQNRAGIEGTLSQAVRRGTLRKSRYRGLQKTQLQEMMTATGINLLRTVNFLNGEPLAKTRTSRFAKLAH